MPSAPPIGLGLPSGPSSPISRVPCCGCCYHSCSRCLFLYKRIHVGHCLRLFPSFHQLLLHQDFSLVSVAYRHALLHSTSTDCKSYSRLPNRATSLYHITAYCSTWPTTSLLPSRILQAPNLPSNQSQTLTAAFASSLPRPPLRSDYVLH